MMEKGNFAEDAVRADEPFLDAAANSSAAVIPFGMERYLLR